MYKSAELQYVFSEHIDRMLRNASRKHTRDWIAASKHTESSARSWHLMCQGTKTTSTHSCLWKIDILQGGGLRLTLTSACAGSVHSRKLCDS